MDPFNMAFYAVVCGCLAGITSRIGSMVLRVVTGVVVGMGAAAALPLLRAALGIGG